MKPYLTLLIKKNVISLIFSLVFCNTLYASQEKRPELNSTRPLYDETQELVRGNGAEIISVDPHQAEGIPDFRVLLDLFEGLVGINQSGEVVPAIAEKWDNIENKEFIFSIRKGAKWSNGKPITAEDFIYSFRRAINPNTATPYAFLYKTAQIVNAKAILDGKLAKESLGVSALAGNRVKIRLENSVPYFTKILAHSVFYPVERHTIEKHGDHWTKPNNFVGNGAFIISNRVPNEKIELTPNPYYWNKKQSQLKRVTYLSLDDQVAEMNRFLSGEIHMTSKVPLEHYQKLKKEQQDTLNTSDRLCTYYYGFNTQKPPFNDGRVRRALSLTIDREIITDKLLGQGQKPSYQFTPSATDNFGLLDIEYRHMTAKQRQKRAQQLLEEAGYGKSNPLTFKLLYNTSENHKKIAIAIQSMWRKSLNVNVMLENQEWKAYLDSRRRGDFDVMRAGWCGLYNEPSAFLTVFSSDSSLNHVGYRNQTFDMLLKTALSTQSPMERSKLYLSAEEQLIKDMPMIPIFQNVTSRLISKRVGGFSPKIVDDNIPSKDLFILSK